MARDPEPMQVDARDPLTAALLPVLMHRLNNATQILQGLNALLSMRATGKLLDRQGEDLAAASQTIDEVGWMLAILASASGADLLLARRERRGLDPLLTAVHDALRRRDRELCPCNTTLPDLSAGVADGWQLPWGISVWLFASALQLPPQSRLEWRLEPLGEFDELGCRTPDHPDRDELEQRIAERLPATRFRRTANEHVWLLPRGSLLWKASSP